MASWPIPRRPQESTCIIELQGSITSDAVAKFHEVIARSGKLGCDHPWLMLESPGGLLRSGIELGKAVRQLRMRTITRDCASSCVSIFLGGVERVLVGSRARVGLHQVTVLDVKTRGAHCEVDESNYASRKIREYLAFAVPSTQDDIMDIVMHTPCNRVEWAYGARALALGIATALQPVDADDIGPRASQSVDTSGQSRGADGQ